MSSISNQIVANIKKTSTNFNSFSFVNSENVVCIDTSRNRIGINRKNPLYSIDISGDSSDDAIRVYNLHINNLAIINEISSNKIDTVSLIGENIDVSHILFETVSGSIVDIISLITHDISSKFIESEVIEANNINVTNEISGNNLFITNDITCHNEITCQKLSADIISLPAVDIPRIDTKQIRIEEYAYIYFADISDIQVNTLSGETLYVKNSLNSLEEATFKDILVTGDANFDKITIDNLSILNDICCNRIITTELSCNSIDVDQLTSNGSILMTNGEFGDPANPRPGNFSDLQCNKLDVGNVTISVNLNNSGTTDLSYGKLILPKHNSGEYDNDNDIFEDGTLTFDGINNKLKVYNNSPSKGWNDIWLNTYYATMKLNTDIIGNEVSYNINKRTFSIELSNQLILDIDRLPNIKYIPLDVVSYFGNKITISEMVNGSKTVEISDREQDEIFEIHATVGIKYLNKDPGDVEPNVYTFGLYPNYKDPDIANVMRSITDAFVEIKNTIIAFDNSFNYATTSLSYIGPLINSKLNHDVDKYDGFNFYITADKDINFIAIDKFNATIKQLPNF
tara:strand:+ start:1038 stop:2747 length:1710 start_codon:yes stop_codon:yes gene_type:complete